MAVCYLRRSEALKIIAILESCPCSTVDLGPVLFYFTDPYSVNYGAFEENLATSRIKRSLTVLSQLTSYLGLRISKRYQILNALAPYREKIKTFQRNDSADFKKLIHQELP